MTDTTNTDTTNTDTPTTAPLPTREIGRTGIRTSVFALGSWHTYDRMDFTDAVDLVARALERGVTLFDVGVYGPPGMRPPVFTDVLFGAIMRAVGVDRSAYLVSEKLWLEGFDEQGFRPQLEHAFLRAGLDYTDLVILGDIRRDDLDLRRVVLDLAEQKEAGRIRAWGVNNWSAEAIQTVIDIAAGEGVDGPAMAQLKYSIARRSIPDGAPFARLFDAGLSMQASDVLEGGILAGNATPSRQVGRDPGEIRRRIIDQLPALTEIADGYGISLAQLAVAFTLTHPHNVTTLFGATRLEQLEQNLAALDTVARVGADALRAAVGPYWTDRDVVDPAGP